MTTSDPSGPTELVDSLAELKQRTEARLEGMKLAQAEIDALIQLPAEGSVTAAFDELGFVRSLEIDPNRQKGIDPALLVRDINIALARAPRPTPQAPSGEPGAVQDSVSAMMSSVMESLLSGASLTPHVYSNDLGTVSVTTLMGEIQSVECAASWIQASSDSSIAEEVQRVANLAALADDPFERRKAGS
jgi:hypothetical protein